MLHQLTREELQDIKARRSYLIDVRSAEEVADRSIPGALNWDVRQMVEGRFPNVDKSSPVFVFCRSGNRSSEAQRLLGAAGFTDSHDLGSIDALPNDLLA